MCTVTYVIDILYETSASSELSCGNKFNKAINVTNILMINSHGDVININYLKLYFTIKPMYICANLFPHFPRFTTYVT